MGGFYIENAGVNTIHIATMDKTMSFILRPQGENGDSAYIDANHADDPNINKILKRGMVRRIENGDEKDALVNAEAQDKRDERDAAALSAIDDSEKESLVERQCCAITKAGTRCAHKVSIKISDMEKDPKPIFCKTHEGTDPSGFVQTDILGDWVPAPVEAAPVETAPIDGETVPVDAE